MLTNNLIIYCMQKKFIILFLLFFSKSYSQGVLKNMENVKYSYKSDQPFLHYDSTKKKLDYLKSFKADNDNKSLLIFYMLAKDSIKIVNGGKIIIEDRFPINTTSVRSIQSISNQKSLEIIFFKENVAKKITITPEDLRKYKFVYISPSESSLQVEFTNVWKMFM